MNQKMIFTFDITKNERNYCFQLPAGAPYGEIYDVLHEFLVEVAKMASEAAAKAKKQEVVADDKKEDA